MGLLYTWWLKQQTFIVSEFWSLEVQDHMSAELVSSESSKEESIAYGGLLASFVIP